MEEDEEFEIKNDSSEEWQGSGKVSGPNSPFSL